MEEEKRKKWQNFTLSPENHKWLQQFKARREMSKVVDDLITDAREAIELVE